MRARTLTLVLLAVILAGGTAFLARAWLAAQRSADMAEASPLALPAPSKSVLVARLGALDPQLDLAHRVQVFVELRAVAGTDARGEPARFFAH